MDENFDERMKRMVSEHGKDVLLGDKAKAFIGDYRGQFKAEAEDFLELLDAGCATYINEADNVLERKRQLAERMEEKLRISPKYSMPLLDLLGFLLRGDKSRIAKMPEELKAEEEVRVRAEVMARLTTETRTKTQSQPSPKPAHGASTVIVSSSYEMVPVPGGSFQMGDTDGGGYDNERPVHMVTLSAFSIGKYQVTQALYQSVTGNNPSKFKGVNLPVENVNWYEAIEFCNKLSEGEGLQPAYTIKSRTPAADYPIRSATVIADWSKNGYRLPTEAEWEYAAKGGNGSPGNFMYSGSNNKDKVAWYQGNSGGTTHEVGKKEPNGLGLYDMSGNVREWCWDWSGSYSISAQTDPTGASSGSYRVFRGGDWCVSVSSARSAYRGSGSPSHWYNSQGFRLVRSLV